MSQDFSSYSSKELQAALSNELFRGMLDTMPLSVAVLSSQQKQGGPEFTYTYANKTALEMAKGDLIGKSIVNDESQLYDTMASVSKSGKSNSFVHKKNSDEWIEYFVHKYDNGIMLVYRNIVDCESIIENKVKEVESALKKKNRELRSLNNELKTFTSVAAYDYKDTLQILYTNLEYIISREAKNFSNTGKANLRKAQTAIQKMKLLTDDIISFSRIQTMDTNLVSVNLNEILASVTKELSDKLMEADAKVQSETLPVISGYPFLLTLLFYHLIDNAVKFRNPDKRLHISIHYAVMPKPGGDLHRVVITDNGIGFPHEDIEKVFQMFYRVHDKAYKGSGIGLAICRKITELHGGSIAAESEPGKGTSVCCFFPMK